MPVLIRDQYLEGQLEQEMAVRGVKTLAGVASDLLLERLTQLDVLRRGVPDVSLPPRGGQGDAPSATPRQRRRRAG